MNRVMVTSLENFKVWKHYELLMKYKQLILTFINNDILDDKSTHDFFIEVFNEYKEECKKFYDLQIEHYEKYLGKTESKSIEFNINFIDRVHTLYLEDEIFDLDVFTLNNLTKDIILQERIINIIDN